MINWKLIALMTITTFLIYCHFTKPFNWYRIVAISCYFFFYFSELIRLAYNKES